MQSQPMRHIQRSLAAAIGSKEANQPDSRPGANPFHGFVEIAIEVFPSGVLRFTNVNVSCCRSKNFVGRENMLFIHSLLRCPIASDSAESVQNNRGRLVSITVRNVLSINYSPLPGWVAAHAGRFLWARLPGCSFDCLLVFSRRCLRLGASWTGTTERRTRIPQCRFHRSRSAACRCAGGEIDGAKLAAAYPADHLGWIDAVASGEFGRRDFLSALAQEQKLSGLFHHARDSASFFDDFLSPFDEDSWEEFLEFQEASRG